MIFADLQDGNLFWNSETNTYSFTSGPRSPTKMEYSGPRSSRLGTRGIRHTPYRQYQQTKWNAYLRSARPPPEAQFSLKGRLELGISWPLRVNAFAAAAGVGKSTKQYPALLLLQNQLPRYLVSSFEVAFYSSAYPENLSRIILTFTCSPMPNQMLRTKFSSIHGSSSPILTRAN